MALAIGCPQAIGMAWRVEVAWCGHLIFPTSRLFSAYGGQWATEVHRALEGDGNPTHTTPRSKYCTRSHPPCLAVCAAVVWGDRSVSPSTYPWRLRGARVDVRRRMTVLSVFL